MTALRQSLQGIDYGLLLTRALVIAVAVHTALWSVIELDLHDLNFAYLPAAERVLAGEQLYGGDVTTWTAYRYAPWFAYAMTPLTLVPYPIIGAVWTGIGLACCAAVVWPLRHGTAGRLATVLLGSLLVGITLRGNVQAWLLALVVLAPDRWRPLAIGIAASLKLTFLPLALVYVGRRQWHRAALSAVATAVLWAPVVLFEIDPITFDPGAARVIPAEWWLVSAVSAAAAAIIVARRWPRFGVLASGVAGVLATPRLYPYETTLLLAAGRDERFADRPPVASTLGTLRAP